MTIDDRSLFIRTLIRDGVYLATNASEENSLANSHISLSEEGTIVVHRDNEIFLSNTDFDQAMLGWAEINDTTLSPFHADATIILQKDWGLVDALSAQTGLQVLEFAVAKQDAQDRLRAAQATDFVVVTIDQEEIDYALDNRFSDSALTEEQLQRVRDASPQDITQALHDNLNNYFYDQVDPAVNNVVDDMIEALAGVNDGEPPMRTTTINATITETTSYGLVFTVDTAELKAHFPVGYDLESDPQNLLSDWVADASTNYTEDDDEVSFRGVEDRTASVDQLTDNHSGGKTHEPYRS